METVVMREVNGDSLAAEKPVAKVFVVWFGSAILHACRKLVAGMPVTCSGD